MLNQSPKRVLFAGTGEFAVPILAALLTSDIVEVVGVITQPDKLAGREQVETASPVKQFLSKANSDSRGVALRLFQPEKLRLDAENILAETTPDVVIVAAYGQMIPDSMLNYPEFKCLNLHGSLLPQLRGAVPVPMAILQGLTRTGVTLQQMVKELDAGGVLAQVELEIEPTDTVATLMPKLADVGAKLLLDTLPGIFRGEVQARAQDAAQVTYCYEADIAKEKAEIKVETEIELAERMVRAFYPWPVAWVTIPVQGQLKRLKIFAARVERGANSSPSSTLRVRRAGKQLFLDLALGSLELLEIQLEGKKRGLATDYLFLAPK